MSIFYILFTLYFLIVRSIHLNISYDEGPFSYTMDLAERMFKKGVSLTFHFDPDKNINEELISKILNLGHEVGMVLPNEDTFEESKNIVDMENKLREKITLFESKCKYSPKLIRFSRYGYPSNMKEISRNLKLFYTRPNFDSEDIEKPYFIEFLREDIKNLNNNTLNMLVLRDNSKNSTSAIDEILNICCDMRYDIITIGEYFGVDVSPIRISHCNKNTTNNNILTEMKICKEYENKQKNNCSETIDCSKITNENSLNLENKEIEKLNENLKKMNDLLSEFSNEININKKENEKLKRDTERQTKEVIIQEVLSSDSIDENKNGNKNKDNNRNKRSNKNKNGESIKSKKESNLEHKDTTVDNNLKNNIEVDHNKEENIEFKDEKIETAAKKGNGCGDLMIISTVILFLLVTLI